MRMCKHRAGPIDHTTNHIRVHTLLYVPISYSVSSSFYYVSPYLARNRNPKS